MRSFSHTFFITLSLLAFSFSLTTQASEPQLVQQFDNYDVHYSIFNTSFLTPEIAKSYGITRSKNQALINIAVIRQNKDGSSEGVAAIVKGTVRDLIHTNDLDFFPVREEKAIYYLSPLRISDNQDVYFDISVQPDPNRSAYHLKFKKRLYVDD